MDERIVEWVKKEHSLLLGLRTAEQIKMSIGSAYPFANEPNAEVRGRDLNSGLPKTILITASEIRTAIEEPVSSIVDSVRVTLDSTPPELAADLMSTGIVITGGGALLKTLTHRIAYETGMKVSRAERPLQSVVIGSGKCLEEYDVLHTVLDSSGRS